MAVECVIQDGEYAGQIGMLFDNYEDMMWYTYLYGMPDTLLVCFKEGGDWALVEDGVEYHMLLPVPGAPDPVETISVLTSTGAHPGIYAITWTAFLTNLAKFWNQMCRVARFLGKTVMRTVVVGALAYFAVPAVLSAVSGVLYPETDWYIDDTTGLACAVTGGRLCCINPQTLRMTCEGSVSPTTDWMMYAAIAIGLVVVLVLVRK